MKAEHRKELQTNALADSVGRMLLALKGGPSRTALLVCGLLLLAVLAFVAWTYFSRSARAGRSAQWLQVDEDDQKLGTALNETQVNSVLDQLEAAAKEHPGTAPTRVMLFTRARTLLRLGLERLYNASEHDKAQQQVEEARTLYARLIGESKDDPVLAQEAMMGVAKARESLGDVDEALNDYRRLADTYPNSALGQKARERADFLGVEENRRQVKDLYDTLAKMTSGSSSAPPPPVP
jgi:tetratricopeptide (TPR) repeat protein